MVKVRDCRVRSKFYVKFIVVSDNPQDYWQRLSGCQPLRLCDN